VTEVVSRATVSPSSSSSSKLVSNWNRTNAFHSHFVPLVLPLLSSKPTILQTSSISESIWSSRTPCSSLSLSLSLTSQHEIYSLKSLELYSRYEFFYAAWSRDKRLRRVPLSGSVSEKHRPYLLTARNDLCERDIVENALETFVALFALESSFTFFSIFSSSSSA